MRSVYSLMIHDTSPWESLKQQEKRLVLSKAFLSKVALLQGRYSIAPVIYSIQIIYCANGDATLADILGQVSYTFSTATLVLVW